jgi:hypothetical protein
VEDQGVTYNGMSIMTDLRKLSNHPLLLRYHYDEHQVKEMAKLLAKDPSYKDTIEEYIVQDLLFMSDFEINKMAKHHRVSMRQKASGQNVDPGCASHYNNVFCFVFVVRKTVRNFNSPPLIFLGITTHFAPSTLKDTLYLSQNIFEDSAKTFFIL